MSRTGMLMSLFHQCIACNTQANVIGMLLNIMRILQTVPANAVVCILKSNTEKTLGTIVMKKNHGGNHSHFQRLIPEHKWIFLFFVLLLKICNLGWAIA